MINLDKGNLVITKNGHRLIIDSINKGVIKGFIVDNENNFIIENSSNGNLIKSVGICTRKNVSSVFDMYTP